jgi:hypothetical protein
MIKQNAAFPPGERRFCCCGVLLSRSCFPDLVFDVGGPSDFPTTDRDLAEFMGRSFRRPYTKSQQL